MTRSAGRRRPKREWADFVRSAALVCFALFTVGLPLWLVLVNALKGTGEANVLGFGLPSDWQAVQNFSTVIEEGRVLLGLRNTLLVAIPSIVLVILVGGFASWGFARCRGRTSSLLYAMCISGILIPPAIVTSVGVLRALGLHGTHIGLALFYSGVFLSFSVFLVTGFVKTIPVELEEAARIDGAGSWTIFTRIIFPLLAPVNVTAAFILLLFIWNDFFYAFFLLTGNENRTLTLGLFNFVSGYQYQVRWNLVFANLVIVSVPLLLVFVIAQRRIVAGLLGVGGGK